MFPRLPLAALAAAALIACSDSTGPSSALTLSHLAGTWDLTRLEMLLASDTSVRQDVKAILGLNASLTITNGGAATLSVQAPGEPTQTVSATISIHGDTIVYQPASGSTYEVTAKLAGRSMTWLAVETGDWDLDGDGSPEEVREREVWQRR